MHVHTCIHAHTVNKHAHNQTHILNIKMYTHTHMCSFLHSHMHPYTQVHMLTLHIYTLSHS